ncbi:hypothetical protein KI387_012321 [Taxus chinensis]|uniref:TF-B3 domain-containing protein n=1 Tax=Taxus chinensis TaxID=29808 RepID=A0AA38CQ70_TAXCH|nr:hypothetical protein KI387_012321 [Taxus chinensis]
MKVFLRVRPHKSPIRYGKFSKLAPFEILKHIGPLAYHLALPPNLSRVHDVFHVSVLRRYIANRFHVLDWTSLQMQDQGKVTVELVRIIDRRTLGLRGKEIDQELNLTGLATSLIQASNTASRSAQRPSNPRKQRTEERPVVMRRSSRVANIPAPNYREEAFDIPYLRKGYSRRSLIPHAIASVKASREAAEHGFKIESDLGFTYPTFVKPMLHSHISGGFWLGLPTDFCKAHMPKQNSRMILEESGEDYETLYLAGKVGLSAGWRGFSIHHGLIEGDCLVFQLIQPTRFKVFIIRSADFESGKKRDLVENESDSVQEQLSQDFDDESDAVQELPMTGKQKRSSADVEEVSSESVEADGKLSKKPKKTPKGLGKAKDGKQQSKKSGKKPFHMSDGEEHEKQHTGSTEAKDSQVPDDEDSTKLTTKATAAPKSRSKKQINSMMPTRKTSTSEVHIKPSNGRVTVAA